MSAAEFLARAEKYLDSAQLLLEHGDPESAVSRAYYAMFFAAEAALLTRQLAFSSHKGVIAAFGEHFVKPGTFPAAMGRDLARAHDKRVVGDYDARPSITPEVASELVHAGRAFVARIRVHVDAPTAR